MSCANPTIVLVHGEEGSTADWYPVVSLLEHAGLAISVTSIPLTSFLDDVAATRRAFAARSARVVAVGHSYGGAVITSAAAGNPQVAALVYLTAFAPDRGESIDDLIQGFESWSTPVMPFAASRPFLPVIRPRHGEFRAGGCDARGIAVLGPAQRSIPAAARLARIVQPAWREIPSWYLTATMDPVIPVRLQRYMAKRLGAVRTVEVDVGHLPQLAQPALVASFIQEAAESCR